MMLFLGSEYQIDYLGMSKYEHKTTQNGHQDSIVLHRSSQKAKWHLQSWLGKWKLTEKLSWQKLLYIISIVLILQIVL